MRLTGGTSPSKSEGDAWRHRFVIWPSVVAARHRMIVDASKITACALTDAVERSMSARRVAVSDRMSA